MATRCARSRAGRDSQAPWSSPGWPSRSFGLPPSSRAASCRRSAITEAPVSTMKPMWWPSTMASASKCPLAPRGIEARWKCQDSSACLNARITSLRRDILKIFRDRKANLHRFPALHLLSRERGRFHRSRWETETNQPRQNVANPEFFHKAINRFPARLSNVESNRKFRRSSLTASLSAGE